MKTARNAMLPTLALLVSCAAAGVSDEEVSTYVARGRALLDSGNPQAAEAVFSEAAELDGGSLRTRMWVLRAWMDQGRSNDTLDALDELNRAGVDGPDMTYLYGMAFAKRAEGYLADGVTDSSVTMNFEDATSMLKEALDADPERFHDAWLPLATSAWHSQELDVAREAADRAVEVAPSPDAWVMRGRILMTQFMGAESEEAGGEEANGLWQEAAASFENAVAGVLHPTTDHELALRTTAATQLGHAMIWRQKGPEATDAYAWAIAGSPMGFDYPQALNLLRGVPKPLDEERDSGFRAALELAHERYAAENEVGEPAEATLLWWLGWARFADADWEGCEDAFLSALDLAPEYSNSWFYVGLARQYRKDSQCALDAMRKGWDADPASMVASAAGAGGAARAFEQLIAWCATQVPARNMDAAFLSEMLSAAFPGEARYWNNLGLFLRDAGEYMEWQHARKEGPEPDPEELADLYQRAYAAYVKALELNPEDPQLLNDTVVMLDYHLGGSQEEALEAYRNVIAMAEERLTDESLSEWDRGRFVQTRKDAESNILRIEDYEAWKVAQAKEAAEAKAAREAAGEVPPPTGLQAPHDPAIHDEHEHVHAQDEEVPAEH